MRGRRLGLGRSPAIPDRTIRGAGIRGAIGAPIRGRFLRRASAALKTGWKGPSRISATAAAPIPTIAMSTVILRFQATCATHIATDSYADTGQELRIWRVEEPATATERGSRAARLGYVGFRMAWMAP